MLAMTLMALVVGCWSAPRNLDADYFSFLADLGFTHTLYWRSPEIKREQWRQDLGRAGQHGITLIFDSWQPEAIPEEWLNAVLETACDHPAFGGVYAPDEPGYRFPLEGKERKPSIERHQSAFEKLQKCGRGVLFHVDAASAERRWVERFLPYSTAFGLDIYPFKAGIDWAERVRRATLQAVELAGERPVWMVLQGHGRADWYHYATQNLGLDIPEETDDRPTPEVLLEMARLALSSGAGGIWWWSFELYDWENPDHREFILRFRKIHRQLRTGR
ncbi:MAG: hypothetical protein ACRD1R_13860 [Acidobacteriota bacterium]